MRITDAAIVAAATLSNRYITDRFLPDKAIDLMDEAASRIRMEVESKPEEIENLDRRIIQLKIEREALKKESDTASKDRLKTLEQELANLEQQSAELTTRWQAEKEKIAGEAKIKEQLDAARIELEQAQRGGDLAKAGELQYGRIPELEKKLNEASQASKGAMLREEVTDQDIAAVVSRWTGIPVERMMEGEREKLLNMQLLVVLGFVVRVGRASVDELRVGRNALAFLDFPGVQQRQYSIHSTLLSGPLQRSIEQRCRLGGLAQFLHRPLNIRAMALGRLGQQLRPE